MKITSPFRSIYSLSPSFAVVSIVSVATAFIAKVPQSRLVTVVIVPLTIGFILNRVFLIAMSRWYFSLSEERLTDIDGTEMPPGANQSLNLVILSGVVGIIATLSSLAYWGLGLKDSAHHAVPIIFWSVIAFVVGFAATVLCVIFLLLRERKMAIRHIENIFATEVSRVWTVARSPQWLIQFVPGGQTAIQASLRTRF